MKGTHLSGDVIFYVSYTVQACFNKNLRGIEYGNVSNIDHLNLVKLLDIPQEA